MYNPFGNQFNPQFIAPTQPLQSWGQNMQRQEIVKVNGENGAKAFQLAPNSSALLLDESAPLVWFVQTDGAGYKTTAPYRIEPYQPRPIPDVGDLDMRLRRLEEMLIGEKPNPGHADQTGRTADAAAE